MTAYNCVPLKTRQGKKFCPFIQTDMLKAEAISVDRIFQFLDFYSNALYTKLVKKSKPCMVLA